MYIIYYLNSQSFIIIVMFIIIITTIVMKIIANFHHTCHLYYCYFHPISNTILHYLLINIITTLINVIFIKKYSTFYCLTH